MKIGRFLGFLVVAGIFVGMSLYEKAVNPYITECYPSYVVVGEYPQTVPCHEVNTLPEEFMTIAIVFFVIAVLVLFIEIIVVLAKRKQPKATETTP